MAKDPIDHNVKAESQNNSPVLSIVKLYDAKFMFVIDCHGVPNKYISSYSSNPGPQHHSNRSKGRAPKYSVHAPASVSVPCPTSL